MSLKLDKADKVFSQYIRLRDGKCVRCGTMVVINTSTGLPVSHQASHYFGRARENTRFDPDNVDTLCHGCHQHWGSADREAYRGFKIDQLGQKNHDLLYFRSNQKKKKDRNMDYLIWKKALKDLIAV